MLNFAAQNIQHDDWRFKNAGLIAIGSITEGPDKLKFLQEFIVPAMPQLELMLTHSNPRVRQVAVWVV